MNLFPLLFQKTFKFLPFLFAVVAIIIYYPSLTGEFLIDDVSYFNNEFITKLSPLDFKAIFIQSSNYWGEHLPVRDYLFVLEHNLFGNWTIGYHIISLILYLGSAFILFYWIKELFGDFYQLNLSKSNKYSASFIPASITLAFFLFNPMYVETVAYISDQKELLSLFFVLLSVRCLYRAAKGINTNIKMLIIGTLFYYFSVLSKLNGIATLFFIPFLWLIVSDKKVGDIIKLIGIWVTLNIPVVLWFFYNLNASDCYKSNLLDTPFLERVLRSFNILGIHISHIIYPWPLSFSYPYNYKWSFDIYFITGVLIVAVAVVLFLKSRKSLINLGLILFIIYLLPVLQIFPEMSNAHIYDHYLAIPLIGVFIILNDLFWKFTTLWGKGRIVIFSVVSLICIGWGTITVNYIPTFKNNVANAAHLYKLYPNWMGAVSTAYNYANSLIIDGQFDEAEKLILSDQCLNRYDWINEYLLGSVYFGKKDYDKAYNYLYSSSIKAMKAGYYPRAKLLLTDILIMRGQYADAKYLLNSLLTEKYNGPNDLNKISVLLKHIETLEGH